MRTHALYALLMAITISPGTCERPNPNTCQQDSDCTNAEKPVCNTATGMCGPTQCAKNADCQNPTPYCAAPGRCIACTGPDQCAANQFCVTTAVDAGLASAQTGSCVSCRTASDCSGKPGTPVCDEGTCRPCKLHSECGSDQLCAKDKSLEMIAMPIMQGSCVPASRIAVVHTQAELATALTPMQWLPYIHLVSSTPVVMSISLAGGLNPPRILHIVGPIADTPPTPKTITQAVPSVTISGTPSAVSFSGDGMNPSTLILEGLIIDNSSTGISCNGNPQKNIQLQIYRSLLTNNSATAVQANNECRLTVDQCWIGRGPGAMSGMTGNGTSISISNSDLTLTNSVFWRNGRNLAFGGISFTEMPGRPTGGFVSSIINCTFADQFLDTVDNHTEYDLNCGGDMSQSPVIMNSIFWQLDALTMGRTHILPSCYQQAPANMTNLASEDSSITMNNNGVLLTTSPFTNETVGDLDLNSLSQTKPLVAGGVMSVQDKMAPDHDLEGKPRNQAHPTIGALEVPH